MDIKIKDKIISRDAKCFIIAEAADNHLGDINTAKEMAMQAKLSGADAIKYQHHLPDEEMLRDIPLSDNFEEPLYEFLVKHALTLENHIQLKKFCDDIGILYMCTPFSYKAALELSEIGIECFKIGSGEMTDHLSLERIADIGLPMILSTGMSTFDEIDEVYQTINKKGIDFALMNCVSEYPPVYEDMNLRTISFMMEKYPDIVIGHSDHTPELYTSYAAVVLGAKIIEKHIILNKTQKGPDQSVSIDMMDLRILVDGIRKIEIALGDEKKIHDREAQIRLWAHRSIVTIKNIKKGQRLTLDNIWTKRPGTGIPSKLINEVLGKKAMRDLPANNLIRWEDIE
jgi:N-acetylneuraminate synthase